MKYLGYLTGIILLLFALLQILVWLQDEYIVIQKVESPDGLRIGVIIGNHGGGGPGYCRDLVYDFPKNSTIPKITSNLSEWLNKEYLVEELGCDEAKSISWKGKELIINEEHITSRSS